MTAAVNATEILRKGFGKAPAVVYLVHGKEEGLKQAVLQRLREVLGNEEFDRAHLDAQETDVSAVIMEALTPPAFSERRLVMVRGVQHLRATAAEQLAEAITSLPATTCLVLYTHAEAEDDSKAKGNTVATKLRSAVEKHGVVIECKSLNVPSFGQWVTARLHEAGKQIERDALERFTFLTAANTAAAEPELQKLICYVGERSTIHKNDVELVVSRTVEAQVFKLVDAIALRDIASAMRLLQDVLDVGGRSEAVVPRLLVLIARQFRLLWQMRQRLDYGNAAEQWFPTDPNLAQLLQRQSYLERSLTEQAQRLSTETLCRAFDLLHQADRVLKGIEEGETDSRRLIERLVIDLCR